MLLFTLRRYRCRSFYYVCFFAFTAFARLKAGGIAGVKLVRVNLKMARVKMKVVKVKAAKVKVMRVKVAK